MSESVNSEGSRPMFGSILRFVSDWAGADARQPPPFRMRREEAPETVIEMQSLIEGEPDDPNEDRNVQRALREWKQISNVDLFLEQVHLNLTLLLMRT